MMPQFHSPSAPIRLASVVPALLTRSAGRWTALGCVARLLLLSTLPAAVQAQFAYTTNNGTITITGYDCVSGGGAVTIPDTITGLPVTSIGGTAFEGCTSLTNVTIPNSVTSLGIWAFASCSNLTSVTIPNSVISVGNHAFHSCAGLTNFTIGNGVTSIGVGAFASCTSLTAITVDALNSAYSSVDGVLFNRSQTTLIQCPEGKAGSYAMPDSVTNIENGAFDSCSSLTSVTIPNSVTNIETAAFQYCTSLSSITIGDSVTSIGEQAFYICTSLTHVTIPNSVTSIGAAAFVSCTSLTQVTIGNSVTSIGYAAFQNCTSLSSITIGNSVTSIGEEAFYICTNLTGVYFQGNAPSLGSIVFLGDDSATVYYLPGTIGWGARFGGRPTAMWVLPYPLILNNGSSFGVRTNRFGFIISWARNISVVVQASSDLGNPIWTPVSTNTLTGGSSYFSDPQWTNHPTRFYRLVSPVP